MNNFTELTMFQHVEIKYLTCLIMVNFNFIDAKVQQLSIRFSLAFNYFFNNKYTKSSKHNFIIVTGLHVKFSNHCSLYFNFRSKTKYLFANKL